MSDSESPDDDAAPPVKWRPLPDEVKRKRWIANANRERASKIVEPRIEGHLKVYGIALDGLTQAHTGIPDETDLDLAGDTRAAAVWIVAGRCIGYARAVLTLVGAGYGGESAAQMRALHEANRLLSALADDGELATSEAVA